MDIWAGLTRCFALRMLFGLSQTQRDFSKCSDLPEFRLITLSYLKIRIQELVRLGELGLLLWTCVSFRSNTWCRRLNNRFTAPLGVVK